MEVGCSELRQERSRAMNGTAVNVGASSLQGPLLVKDLPTAASKVRFSHNYFKIPLVE